MNSTPPRVVRPIVVPPLPPRIRPVRELPILPRNLFPEEDANTETEDDMPPPPPPVRRRLS